MKHHLFNTHSTIFFSFFKIESNLHTKELVEKPSIVLPDKANKGEPLLIEAKRKSTMDMEPCSRSLSHRFPLRPSSIIKL